MPRQIGSNQPPELTDRTQAAYQTVQQNMMQNFQFASDALTAKAQADNADYAEQIQRWQNEEEKRAYESQGGGGGVLETIGQLGQQLVAGYAILDEVQARKAAQKKQDELTAKQMAMQEEEFSLKKQQVEAGIQLDQAQFDYQKEKDAKSFEIQEAQMTAEQVAAENKAKKEQTDYNLDTAVDYLNNEILRIQGALGEVVAQYGDTAGAAQYGELMKSMMESETFKMLDPQRQEEVKKNLYQLGVEMKFKNARDVYKEQKDAIKTQLGVVTQRWQIENTYKLNQLSEGVGVLSFEEANKLAEELISNYQSMFAKDEYKYMLTNPQAATESMIEVYKIVGQSLNKYAQGTAENQAKVNRFIQASNGIAMLEMKRQDGTIKSDLEFQQQAESLLKGLGIDTDYRNFSTSLPNRMEQGNNLLEMQMKRRQLIAKDKTLEGVIGNSNPAGDKAGRYLVGEYVYQNLDAPELAIQRLELAKEAGSLAPDVAQTQINLLKEFAPDRDRYNKLQQEQQKLTAQIEKLKYQPNSRNVVVPPGTITGGTVTEGYGSTTVPITPIPEASEAEINEINEQIKTIQLTKESLVGKWMAYGINLTRPSDHSYLEKMKQGAQAALDTIEQESTARGVNPKPVAIPEPDNDPLDVKPIPGYPGSTTGKAGNEEQSSGGVPAWKKANGAVVYEMQANEFGRFNKIYEDKVEPFLMDANMSPLLKQNFVRASREIMKVTLSGEDSKVLPYIDQIAKSTLATVDSSVRYELEKEFRKGLRESYELIRNKRNYYRNKFGMQSRSNTPPSFSSGSTAKRQEVQGIVATVSDEGTLAPSLHLKGNLATHKELGWAPFKGGNVSITGHFGEDRGSHKHGGLDLVSSDKRLASIQGGKVKFAGWWNDYGNTVMVETPDGHVELYAHLDQIGVKKGQWLQPADQLGIMGNTGRSRGAHLHFEVWTNSDWEHPSEVKGRGTINPVGYLNKFKGKTVLPKVTGGIKHTQEDTSDGQPASEMYAYRTKNVAYHTGAFKLSNGLTYFKGFIYDTNGGGIRKATAKEEAMLRTPEIIYRTTRELYRVQNGAGQTVRNVYDIPEKAQNEGTFMMLRPAGHTSGGKDVWYIEGYKGNVRMFQKPVLSVPTPDGDYKVTKEFNYAPFANPAHKKDVTDFITRNGGGKGLNMYVRSTPRQELLQGAPVGGFKKGHLDLRNSMSINYDDYKAYGDGSEDYGYGALRRDNKLKTIVNQEAKELGVPGVWIADQIAMESEWNPTICNKLGYCGYFQVKDEHLYGITAAEMKDKYKQLGSAYVKYHKAIAREVGGYRNFEEFLMGVWGGGKGVEAYRQANGSNRNTRFTYRELTPGGINWDRYRKILEQKSGRRYNWNGVNMSSTLSHYHDSPSDDCPVCNSMTRAAYFQPHLY